MRFTPCYALVMPVYRFCNMPPLSLQSIIKKMIMNAKKVQFIYDLFRVVILVGFLTVLYLII